MFKPFVPKGQILGQDAALGVMNGLHIFVASLERGRPSEMTERVARQKEMKYVGQERIYVFDRALADLYQLALDDRGLSLLTVTWLNDERRFTILDELRPLATFENVTSISVPYILAPEVDPSEYSYLVTPQGRYLEIQFGVPTMGPRHR